MKSQQCCFHIFILSALLGSICLTSCQDGPSVPDVSDQQIDSRWIRFDKQLTAVDSQDEIARLYEQYPAFAPLYFHRVLQLPQGEDGRVAIDEIRKMRQAETFTHIIRANGGYYAQDEDVRSSWEEAMKYYQHHFSSPAPDLYLTLSEFGIACFLFKDEEDQDAVGVSLDMFLGDSMDYEPLAKMDPLFSAYSSRTFDRDHLVIRALLLLIEDKLPEVRSRRFLDHFITEGKKQYAIAQLAPYVHDSLRWQVTADQWTWLEDNEWNLYSHLVTEELFYSEDYGRYIRLLQPAPKTPGLPLEAPGRALIYTAYKIVDQYMTRHPAITLPQLLSEIDAETIFLGAKYRPDPKGG